jgi:hypothetical protein
MLAMINILWNLVQNEKNVEITAPN